MPREVIWDYIKRNGKLIEQLADNISKIVKLINLLACIQIWLGFNFINLIHSGNESKFDEIKPDWIKKQAKQISRPVSFQFGIQLMISVCFQFIQPIHRAKTILAEMNSNWNINDAEWNYLAHVNSMQQTS